MRKVLVQKYAIDLNLNIVLKIVKAQNLVNFIKISKI